LVPSTVHFSAHPFGNIWSLPTGLRRGHTGRVRGSFGHGSNGGLIRCRILEFRRRTRWTRGPILSGCRATAEKDCGNSYRYKAFCHDCLPAAIIPRSNADEFVRFLRGHVGKPQTLQRCHACTIFFCIPVEVKPACGRLQQSRSRQTREALHKKAPVTVPGSGAFQ
jgi:hypothetical protein